MAENQNIEYKQSWRDEYLKWICGFANAQGGKIFIGINDKGEVIGLEDYKKLMDEIPNKAVNHLGLVVDVNLHKKGNKHYIEIDVPANTVPISYHGIYHYRSGSTKQELKGPALHKFLLQKIGVSWEQQIVSNATLDDIDDNTIKRFLQKAINHKRISEHAASTDALTLLKNLELINEKGEFLLKDYHGTTIFLSIYDNRLEIWNPGKLPDSLTIDQLKAKHRSVPRNRLIADVFFMAGYIEAWGRDIDIMIEGCRQYGFPDPIISEEQDGISVTLQQDIYTEEHLRALHLNDRQIKAILFIKEKGEISNTSYQTLNSISKPVATKELSDLVSQNLIQKLGTTGKGTKYILSQTARKGLKRLSKGF